MEPYTKHTDLYAFWRYDQFPYVLGGTVTRMRHDGWVETKEYGKGSWFKPIRLLPIASGKELREKLRELEMSLDREVAKVEGRHDQLLATLFPEAIVE